MICQRSMSWNSVARCGSRDMCALGVRPMRMGKRSDLSEMVFRDGFGHGKSHHLCGRPGKLQIHSNVLPSSAVSSILDIADAAPAPGTVDAPIGVIAVSAIVMSAAVFLVFSFGLKPGTDAAIEMQKRDARSGRFRSKDKK